ncbi:MAG: zinc-ribbon domain-containing protein [Clostridiales bacterium]|nr:zinc-ribbon domain-containing protein [Clostridiales bacterium]
MKCHKCGAIVERDDNFCTYCGAKLHEVCNCWVLHKRNNCNLKKCPGLMLHVIMYRNNINDK